MKVITPLADMGSHRARYAVWEYDESRPRNLEAADPRKRFAVKRFIGSFSTLAEAEGSSKP